MGLCAMGLSMAAPAQAQNWFEKLIGAGKEEAPAAQPAPRAPAAPPAAVPNPPGAAAKAGEKGSEKSAPAAAKAAMPRPPSAPPAGQSAAAIAAPANPLSNREIVDRTNAYFNRMRTVVGDFTQIGGDGRRNTGKLYLQRPGKLRFDYTAPSTLEVIADGSQVAVRDSKLATQDLYPISQTPLKFLLKERIDIEADTRLIGISNDQEGVKVEFEDRSTLGGTSTITLFFDKDVEVLNQWRIRDPQGFFTSVSLANLDASKRIDGRLFAIDYTRIIDSSGGNR